MNNILSKWFYPKIDNKFIKDIKKIINSKQIDKMNVNAFKFARTNLNVKSFVNKLEKI